MSVQYIRLISGENVVADVVEDTAEGLTVCDAITAVPANADGTQLDLFLSHLFKILLRRNLPFLNRL